MPKECLFWHYLCLLETYQKYLYIKKQDEIIHYIVFGGIVRSGYASADFAACAASCR